MTYKRKYWRYSFIKPDRTLRNNLMAFGFECGRGWYPVIYEAFDKIQKYLNNWKNWKLRKDFRVVQVKEKFGGLRIYCNFDTDYIDNIINEACRIAYETCENCGTKDNNVSTRTVYGWMTTLCEPCANKSEEESAKRLETFKAQLKDLK